MEQANHCTMCMVPDQDGPRCGHREYITTLLRQERPRLVVKAHKTVLARSDDQQTRSLLEHVLGLRQRNAM
jgi:hypothetical protein